MCRASVPHKRDVNTVFQHYALFPHMTVAENVAYGLRQKGVDRRETSPGRRGARDGEDDAAGQAQAAAALRRPAAARRPRPRLVNRPSVLLLDEPLGALDRKLRQEMQIELKLLQTEVGITFIYVTHDQEEALSMSDRIAVMLDGHVEQLADAGRDLRPAGHGVRRRLHRAAELPPRRGEGRRPRAAPDTYTVLGSAAGGRRRRRADALAAVRPEYVQGLAEDPGTSVNVAAGHLAGRPTSAS